MRQVAGSSQRPLNSTGTGCPARSGIPSAARAMRSAMAATRGSATAERSGHLMPRRERLAEPEEGWLGRVRRVEGQRFIGAEVRMDPGVGIGETPQCDRLAGRLLDAGGCDVMVERALRSEALGTRAGKPPHAHIQLGDLDHEPEFAEAVDVCPNVAGTRVLRDVE